MVVRLSSALLAHVIFNKELTTKSMFYRFRYDLKGIGIKMSHQHKQCFKIEPL